MFNTSLNRFCGVTSPFQPSELNLKIIFKVKSNMAAKKKSSKSEITLPWTTDMFNTSLNRFFGVTSPFLPSKKNLKIIFKVKCNMAITKFIEIGKSSLHWTTNVSSTSLNRFWGITSPFLPSQKLQRHHQGWMQYGHYKINKNPLLLNVGLVQYLIE